MLAFEHYVSFYTFLTAALEFANTDRQAQKLFLVRLSVSQSTYSTKDNGIVSFFQFLIGLPLPLQCVFDSNRYPTYQFTSLCRQFVLLKIFYNQFNCCNILCCNFIDSICVINCTVIYLVGLIDCNYIIIVQCK